MHNQICRYEDRLDEIGKEKNYFAYNIGYILLYYNINYLHLELCISDNLLYCYYKS